VAEDVLIFFLLTQVLVTVARIQKLLWAIILSELVVTSISIFLSFRAIWVGERLLWFQSRNTRVELLGIAEALTNPIHSRNLRYPALHSWSKLAGCGGYLHDVDV